METTITKTQQYIISLKEMIENKILVTLKHLNSTPFAHNQLTHGWRYGGNVMRPNGVGKGSSKRGRAYLKKIQGQSKIGVGKRNSSGARGIRVMQRHGVRNMLMEMQRRENTGGRRWDHGKRDPGRGKQTQLQQRLESGSRRKLSGKRTDTRLAKNPKIEGARQSNLWVRNLPKLLNPTGNPVKDAKLAKLAKNRLYGTVGMSNPKKQQNKKFEKENKSETQKILARLRYKDPRQQQTSGKKPTFNARANYAKFRLQRDLEAPGKKAPARLVRSKKELQSLIGALEYLIAQKETVNNFELMETPSIKSLSQTLVKFHSYIKDE